MEILSSIYIFSINSYLETLNKKLDVSISIKNLVGIVMTAQIPDKATYKGEEFDIVGVSGSDLFDPKAHGLQVMMASTACYNGYILSYKCENDEFILDKIHFRTNEKPVNINGVKAKKHKEKYSMFNYKFENLQMKTEFTGDIIIARNFIQEMYVHMGYQRPMAFREVYRFIIENDKIIEVKDLSKRMEERRKEDSSKDSYPTNPEDEKEVHTWISKTFSREIEED